VRRFERLDERGVEALHVDDFVIGSDVTLYLWGTPCDGKSKPVSSDRFVAQCFAQASDIATTMVEQGFACDRIKFSGGHYSEEGKGNSCEARPPWGPTLDPLAVPSR
jgi:endonuclease YncB( thermonuclease family)